MRAFIVHAHHEPASFSGAMTREADRVLRAAGHEIVISDLYAMRFDPVSDRRNFVTVADPAYLKQQQEEEYACTRDGFTPALQAEMNKLAWCDLLIFQFPLWWLGMPAILKGWVDRVFAAGRVYGGGRYFNRGMFVGKRALCAVTIGGPTTAYSENGMYGPIEPILFPIHHGILGFVGFTVLAPFIVHAPARISQQERLQHLERYGKHLLSLDDAKIIPMPDAPESEAFVRTASSSPVPCRNVEVVQP